MIRRLAEPGKELTIAGASSFRAASGTTSDALPVITESWPASEPLLRVQAGMGRLSPTPASGSPGTTLSEDDLPSLDSTVPCEWTVVDRAPCSQAVPCPFEARWRVVSKSTRCDCGKHIVLCCDAHEKQLRKEAAAGELMCKAHEIPVVYIRSVPL